jgi:hypothetical protein
MAKYKIIFGEQSFEVSAEAIVTAKDDIVIFLYDTKSSMRYGENIVAVCPKDSIIIRLDDK